MRPFEFCVCVSVTWTKNFKLKYNKFLTPILLKFLYVVGVWVRTYFFSRSKCFKLDFALFL